MFFRNIIFTGTMLAALLGSAIELPLVNPAPPFVQKKTSVGEKKKCPAIFDAKRSRIIFGSKTLQIFPSGFLQFMDSGREITRVYFYGNTPYSPWMTNTNIGIRVPGKYGNHLGVDSFVTDEKNRTFTVTGKIPFHKKGTPEVLGSYKFDVRLLPGDKVSVRLVLNRPAAGKDGRMSLMCVTPSAVNYTADGKEMSFPVKAGKQNGHWRAKKIRVKDAAAGNSFEITMRSSATVWARRNNLIAVLAHENKKSPSRLVTEFIFDPLSWNNKKASGKVDLAKVEALDEAEPASRNLFKNPYLAQGLNYMGFNHQLKMWHGIESMKLSSDNPKFGENCLLIKTTKAHDGYSFPGMISAEPGVYTFSFYARAEKEAKIRMYAANHAYKGYTSRIFSIGQQWKRYQVQIKVPAITALQIAVRAYSRGKESVNVYLDGFQLERGSVMTAFDSSPATARLLTAKADDFLRQGDPIRARLYLSTLRKKVKGTVNVQVLDMFDTVLYKKQASFSFGKNEHPQIRLDLEGKIPSGVHLVKADFDAEGKKYTEYFRFSIMPFFKNQHKHKNLFAQNYFGGMSYMDVYPGLEDYIRRSMYIGSGSDTHQPYPTPALDALCRKYNYEIIDSSLGSRTSASHMKKLFPKTEPKAGHQYYFIYWTDTREQFWNRQGGLIPDYRLVPGGWTAQYRKNIVDTVASIVKKSSPRRIYEIGSEWSDELKSDPRYTDLILAVREGVKKVYPDSLFGEAGSYNMDVGGGVREIDRTLTKLKGKMPIEVIHCHTYTHDILALEPNFKALVDVVEKKHGHKNVKYFFGEGMHYGPYDVPAWGLKSITWNGVNGCFAPSPFSYDMGWTEKKGAAYYMRSYLIFMTKINQVIAVNSSVTNMRGGFCVDVQMRPRLYQKVPNTLSMLLGNAKRFVKDVSFAAHTKCLIWEDEQGRPVTAVWYQDPLADAGMKQGPWAEAKLPKGIEIYDMMGIRRKVRADGRFPVSIFPFFFRGRKGELDLYIRTFANARIVGDKTLPFRSTSMLQSATHGALTLTNFRAVKTTADIRTAAGKKSITLPPLGKVTVQAPLEGKVRYDRISQVSIPCEVTCDGRTYKSKDSFRVLAVKRFTGDWKKIPSFVIGNKQTFKKKASSDRDFSARGQLAWDKDHFHIRITVKDDVFMHIPFAATSERWNNDSLQIFIDTRCSARTKNLRTFDEDDYAYTLNPDSNGKGAFMFRFRTPDIQLTMGVTAPKDMTVAKDIPCKFTRTSDGYIYETAIPARYMLPARLEKNYSMGLALYLNDRDTRGKKTGVENTLTMTPPGTAPYNRPHFYPVIILSD